MTPFGIVIAHPPEIALVQGDFNNGKIAIDISVKLIVILGLLIIVILHFAVRKGLMFILSIDGVMALAIIVFGITEIGILLAYISKYGSISEQSDNFVDSYQASKLYSYYKEIRSILTFIVLICMVVFLRFYSSVRIMFQPYVMVIPSVFKFALFYILYILALSVLSMSLMGPIDGDFGTLSSSFVQMVLISIKRGKTFYVNLSLFERGMIILISLFAGLMLTPFFVIVMYESTRLLSLYYNYSPSIIDNFSSKRMKERFERYSVRWTKFKSFMRACCKAVKRLAKLCCKKKQA